jgi:hypothetical protein
MDLALLWIFCLAAALLTAAFFLGLAAGFNRALWRYGIGGIPAGVIFVFLLVPTVMSGWLRADNIRPLWLFPYTLSLTLSYLAGIIIMLRRGMSTAEATPPAAMWPQARLALSAAVMICLTTGLYLYMDLKALIELSAIRAESSVQAQNLLPARIGDHLNAARLYEAAAADIKIKKGEKRPQWFYESEPAAFKPLSEEAAQLVQKYRHVLSAVRKAAALPGYSVEVDPTDLFNSPLPNYIAFRDFSKLLVLSAQQKVRSGDTAGAVQELETIRRMAAHIRNTPNIICLMVAGVLDQLYTSGMQYVLAHAAKIPDGLIRTPLPPLEEMRSSIHSAFTFEAVFGLQGLSNFDHSLDKNLLYTDKAAPLLILLKIMGARFWRVFCAADELSAHRYFWKRMLARIDQPPDKREGGWQEWIQRRQTGPQGLLTSVYTANFAGYAVRAERYLTMRRLVNMGLAAEAFRMDRGRYPARPEELVPDYLKAVPVDPFDGNPLKMKAIDGGVDLFSSGAGSQDVGKKSPYLGPVHFYLGREAYQQNIVASIQSQEAQKHAKQKKRNKK